MKGAKVTFIVPCYNEARVLPEFYRRISAVAKDLMEYECEFIFINDGSHDNTDAILNGLAASDSRVKVLHFARNLGHQVALTAGMDFAAGDIIITIDADLQDPPEVAKEMISRIREGYEVVHAQRRTRAGESRFKLFTAWLFYKLMSRLTGNQLVENSGDFRAFTKPVLTAVQGFRERNRYIRGIFSLVGFRQCIVQYDRVARYAGSSKYSVAKMLQLAFNAVLGFSSFPIQVILILSFLMWSASLVYLAKALVDHYVYKITVQGWTSIIILMTFFTGIIIFCLSIIGLYVGRVFEQGQRRPLYWLCDARNTTIGGANNTVKEVKLSHDIMEK